MLRDSLEARGWRGKLSLQSGISVDPFPIARIEYMKTERYPNHAIT